MPRRSAPFLSLMLLALALALTLYAFRISLGARPVLVPAEQT